MNQTEKDKSKHIETTFSAILAEPMEPGKKRLFKELYKLNVQVEEIKEMIRQTNNPIKRIKLKKKQAELQTEILHYFETLQNYKRLH